MTPPVQLIPMPSWGHSSVAKVHLGDGYCLLTHPDHEPHILYFGAGAVSMEWRPLYLNELIEFREHLV